MIRKAILGALAWLLFSQIAGPRLLAQVTESVSLDSMMADTEFRLSDSSVFKIKYVVSNPLIQGYLDVHLQLEDGDTMISAKMLEDSLKLYEGEGAGAVPMVVQKVVPQSFDVVTIIVDVSSSMWRTQGGKFVHMDSAKAIVDSLVGDILYDYQVNLYTYDEQLYEKALDGPEAMRNVKRPTVAKYTHLYESVDQALAKMQGSLGKKILIIVGDGENDHNKKLPVTITRADLLDKIRSLDDSWYIFPVALGSQRTPEFENNIRQLVGATANTSDSIIHGWPQEELFDLVQNMEKWPVTHKVLVKSDKFPHIGRTRTLHATFYNKEDWSDYRIGGLYNGWNEQTSWQWDAFAGGFLIFSLLIAFAVFVPRQQWRSFRKKYVKQYWEVKKEGIRKYDPLTKFPFRDEDYVVVRCDHMTSLETWQFEGRKGKSSGGSRKRKNRCIYYPNKCEQGTSPGGSSDFFAQEGIYKQLFWVFLGAFGGFLAWGAWGLHETSQRIFFEGWVSKLVELPWIKQRFGLSGFEALSADSARIAAETAVRPFMEQVVLGGLVGCLVVLVLAFSHEYAQSRGSFKGLILFKGIMRSLLRALFGTIAGALVFAGAGALQFLVFTSGLYLIGLGSMILLGVLLGRILTTKSGIRHMRGFLAGLLAGFVAFHIYYIPMVLFQLRGNEAPKMVAFVVFGALLGLILSRGTPALEASEMEVFTGRKSYGKVHVTALLRKNEDVSIGRGPTATVRMKVRHTPSHNARSNITQTFAKLDLRNEIVYLVPEIFTEVNGNPIAPNERIALLDGDKIEFRHRSPSYLVYREHRLGAKPKRKRKFRRRRKKSSSEASVT